MDALSDAIRERVTPLAGPFSGYAVAAALEARGWRIVRGTHTVVNAAWLADVLVMLNHPRHSDDNTPGQKAALYDRLVATLNAHGRGSI